MKTYSVRAMLHRELLPERPHRQTTLVVRAKNKREALLLMGMAAGRREAFRESDWRWSGQTDVAKFVSVAMSVLPGVVLYESGADYSDQWRILHPPETG